MADFVQRRLWYNHEYLAWLATEKPEPVLEPELPIVDAHHHMWAMTKPPPTTFVNLGSYLLPQMLEDIAGGGHKVESTVFVQCGAMYSTDGPEHLRCCGETRFMQGVAAMCESGVFGRVQVAKAIIGYADLRMGNAVEEVLHEHMLAGRNFRGIRQIPEPGNDSLFMDPEFRKGFAVLAKHGLTFDHWCPNPRMLPSLLQLARDFPSAIIVVDHLGASISPTHMPVGGESFKQWQHDITAISTQANVYLKLGGSQMGNKGFKFGRADRSTPVGSAELAEALLPWFSFCIDTFGPSRCMFESNFPVDKTEVTYRTLWNAFKRIAAAKQLSQGDKNEIFRGTAIRAYRLGQPTAAAL